MLFRRKITKLFFSKSIDHNDFIILYSFTYYYYVYSFEFWLLFTRIVFEKEKLKIVLFV